MNRFVPLVTTAALLAFSAPGFAAAKPNVLVIPADELGYGELSCQGFTQQIPTPNIDSIAKNSVRFTSGYVSGPYCSPTRAARDHILEKHRKPPMPSARASPLTCFCDRM